MNLTALEDSPLSCFFDFAFDFVFCCLFFALFCFYLAVNRLITHKSQYIFTQSAGAVKYTDCSSAER